MLHAVIMAGGSGTRFWPRSTRDRPKQFLTIFGDRTMLQATADRIEPLVPADRIWVITNDSYVDLVAEQLPEVPKRNIIGEPVARNTAPCVGAAAALILQQDPEGTMVVLPADHQIKNPDQFLSILETAEARASLEESLVTIGIEPTHPETGYGYIEFDDSVSDTLRGNEVKAVKRFREKPDPATARSFLDAGNFLWNSGMFVWKASAIKKEFKKHLPDIYEQIETLQTSLDNKDGKQAIDDFYHACPPVSIDYGIMEHAENVFVVPGEFGWNDVGSWRAVYELRDKDEQGNAIQADWTITQGSSNNLIHSRSGKIIALVGVENLAVVETENAILVCNMDEAQDVKQVVESLKEKDETKKFL